MKNHSIKDPLVSRVYNANTFISSHHINQVNEECTNPYKIIFLLLVKKSSMPCGVTVWERKEVTKKCYKFYNELKIFFCLRFTDKIYENYDNNFNFFFFFFSHTTSILAVETILFQHKEENWKFLCVFDLFSLVRNESE